jgi:hypothetical protein
MAREGGQEPPVVRKGRQEQPPSSPLWPKLEPIAARAPRSRVGMKLVLRRRHRGPAPPRAHGRLKGACPPLASSRRTSAGAEQGHPIPALPPPRGGPGGPRPYVLPSR